jgi:hypothetical protein
VLAAAAVVLSACTSSTDQLQDDALPEPRPAPGSPEVLSTDSPWYLPIPDEPRIDEESDTMVSVLNRDGGAIALLYEYGVTVYEVDERTPGVKVHCTQEGWGECPVEDRLVPVPEGARPSSGSDGAMVVVDYAAERVYDFWQAKAESSGNWSTTWATWAPFGSEGVGDAGGATGAGVNLLAGLVRTEEIEAGAIDHALAFVASDSCAFVYRYPATKTDGDVWDEPCVPQGARVQLDPSIDVEGIPGITPGEIAVAKALQTYGAFLRDKSETAMGIVFETPTTEADPYPDAAGFPYDFYEMPHIPWDRLRVLAEWDGT